jgi:hypothetical protein
MHVRQVRDLKLATLDPTATCAVEALLELSPNCCLAQKSVLCPGMAAQGLGHHSPKKHHRRPMLSGVACRRKRRFWHDRMHSGSRHRIEFRIF